MTDPIVFDVKPVAAELSGGEEYHWCRCGRSSGQPFCDGSHRGTDLVPKAFSVDKDGEAYLCQCKQTRNPPYCDGSHKSLQGTDVGRAVAAPIIGDALKAQATAEEPTVVYIHELAGLESPADYREIADRVRELSGGIPIGFKLSANHIEQDIDFALEASADYVILDGRGGGTGAAPLIFRDNISVPTIPALARARRHLDTMGREDITLIITGGLRTPADFIKALCLGADGIAVSNSAMQAIGCVAARMCNTNNCPTGIATQDPELRKRMDVEKGAARLHNFFSASAELMQVMARACGHDHLNQFTLDDLTTWKKEMAELSGIRYAGVSL